MAPGRTGRIALTGLLLTGVVCAGPGAAAEPDFAYGAYQAGHYQRAAREATDRLAKDSNDTAAMTLLGEIHRLGLGVRIDTSVATDWYRLAADRGDSHAMHALALALFSGQGVARDTAKASALLEKAAAKGHPEACYNLAIALLASSDPDQLQRAVTLLQAAAEAEIADAQHALASLIKQGRGVTKDADAAADMMRRAAANGSLAGVVELAIMVFNGDGTGKDERAAGRLFTRAATRGNVIAQNRLARLLGSGRGISRNLVEAAGWHLAARSQGLSDATLDAIYEGLSPEDRRKAQELAADRIEDAALTSLTRPGK
jgi:uncharacterized protein